MKKSVLAVAVAVFAMSANAFAAVTAGTYTGTITSVLPELNNQAVTMDLKLIGNKSVATVKYQGGEEVWSWDDKVLDQQEIVNGQPTLQYKAKVIDQPNVYHINCVDKTANKCDADVDSRNFWTLNTTPTSVTYIVNGVDPKKKSDPTAKAEKRHEFKFNLKTN